MWDGYYDEEMTFDYLWMCSGQNMQSFVTATMHLLLFQNLQKRYLAYRECITLHTRYPIWSTAFRNITCNPIEKAPRTRHLGTHNAVLWAEPFSSSPVPREIIKPFSPQQRRCQIQRGRRVSGMTFIWYAESGKAGKPNILKRLGNK